MRHSRREFAGFRCCRRRLPSRHPCRLNRPSAWSQAATTMKIVVPFAPGGPTDTMARLFASPIGREQGLTMLVVNFRGRARQSEPKPCRAPCPTAAPCWSNSFIINPSLKALSYDPLTCFAPICMLVRSPHFIDVNSASPFRTLRRSPQHRVAGPRSVEAREQQTVRSACAARNSAHICASSIMSMAVSYGRPT